MLRQHNVISDDDDIVNTDGRENTSISHAEKLKIVPMVDDDESSTSRTGGRNNHNVGIHDIATLLKPLETEHSNDKNSTHIQLKFGNLNIGKLSNLNIGQNTRPEPKHEKVVGDKELPLIADFSFENDSTGQKSWERCVSTIQFDQGTKKLWQDLQKPYGNQSSFIRHLIMLEKYWRSGALVLSANAEPGAVKYINSVKNRVESLETSTSPKILPKNSVSTTTPSSRNVAPMAAATTTTTTTTTTSNCLRVCNGSSNVDVASRHVSAPPPLLKLSSIPTSYVMRQVQVGNVKSFPEIGYELIKSHASSRAVPLAQCLPPPPILRKMSDPVVRRVPHAHKLDKGASHSQPSRPRQFFQVGCSNAPVMNSASFREKPTQNGVRLTSTPSSTVSVNFPARQFASPLMKTSNSNDQPLLIPKLPKALTVTQIQEPSVRTKHDSNSPFVLAPFLAGEKPSISVFREVTK